MQATITTLCVKNETNREIERAGLTFDAGEVREVEVPIGARVRRSWPTSGSGSRSWATTASRLPPR